MQRSTIFGRVLVMLAVVAVLFGIFWMTGTPTPPQSAPQLAVVTPNTTTHSLNASQPPVSTPKATAVTTTPKPTVHSEPTVTAKPIATVTPRPEATPKPIVKAKPQPVIKKKPVYVAPKQVYVTMSAKYWRTHPDLLGGYLPITLSTSKHIREPIVVTSVGDARSVLSYAGSADGLLRMRAQLLAAKLNSKLGFYPPSFTRSEAERLVDWYKYAEWGRLSAYNQGYVNDITNQLRSFNSSVQRKV